MGQVFQLAPVVVHGLRGAVNDHAVFYKIGLAAPALPLRPAAAITGSLPVAAL